jgi:hypothetical protein
MWEENIKMHLTEMGLEGVDWNHLVQQRDWWQAHVNMAIKLPGPRSFLNS